MGTWWKFPRSVINYPICAVSRGSILTGRRQANLGGFWYHGDPADTAVAGTAAYWDNAVGGADSGRNMMPRWLQRAGYFCGCYGKYLNVFPFNRGDTYIPEGWNDWRVFLDDNELGGAHASHTGPDYFNYVMNLNGTITSFGSSDNWTTSGSDASGRTGATDYSTDRISSQVQASINDRAIQPFYLHVGLYAVKQSGATGPAKRHSRSVADATTTLGVAQLNSSTALFTAQDIGKEVVSANFPAGTTIATRVDASTITTSAAATATGVNVSATFRLLYTAERAPSFAEADISDKPAWLRAEKPTVPSTAQQTAWDDTQRQKWRSAQAIDELIRDMVSVLTTKGWLDRTYIVVTTENSNAEGQHRFDQKGIPYEPVITSPLYVHVPTTTTRANVILVIVDDALVDMWAKMVYLDGLPTVTSNAMVSTIDLAPTFLEIAGARRHATRAPDGMSFVPLLDGRITASQWRQAAISEWVNNTSISAAIPTWQSLRTATRRYSDLAAVGAHPAESELYLLDTDPDELVNQTNNATYATEKADLAAQLAALKAG